MLHLKDTKTMLKEIFRNVLVQNNVFYLFLKSSPGYKIKALFSLYMLGFSFMEKNIDSELKSNKETTPSNTMC